MLRKHEFTIMRGFGSGTAGSSVERDGMGVESRKAHLLLLYSATWSDFVAC